MAIRLGRGVAWKGYEHHMIMNSECPRSLTGSRPCRHAAAWSAWLLAATVAMGAPSAAAQSQPELVDPNLGVRQVVGGLVEPTTMAFLGPNDFLVLEKSTGRVRRVVDGTITATVLDLAVNSGSER